MSAGEIRAHARGTVIRSTAPCCDMHNIHCEPWEECCHSCTEITHHVAGHGGTRCVLNEFRE